MKADDRRLCQDLCSDESSEFLKWVKDPDYPLTFCILYNVQAAVQIVVEADLTASPVI
jgi:hypothetical protein